MEQEKKLKLNWKNTFKIGFAFFGILMLWQIYNHYCPIILEELFKEMFGPEKDYFLITGIIMALDNVVAIIIMPIFGKLSDGTNTKWGKRMPYILIGMLLTILCFPFIALCFYWNSLVGVLIAMLLFLVIMQAYRSPAVALMPDVTPKPLRSTANGIINLVGYLGGVLATVLGMVFTVKADDSLAKIQGTVLWPFVITTLVFIGVLVFLVLKVKENKLLAETKEDMELGEKMSDTQEVIEEGDNKLSKKDLKNLMVILVAIFLWFMSFNAYETFGSLYFKNVVGNSGVFGTMATVLSVTSILSFILFSGLSNKIGRKWTVILGLCLMVLSLVLISLVSVLPGIVFADQEGKVFFGWTIFFIGMAAIMGVGWALININSFPMIVEFSNRQHLGKFTGYYYFASMLAQSITPILVGLIMVNSNLALRLLFIYSAVLMILSLGVFFVVKEKYTLKERIEMSKSEEKKSALERIGEMDD